MIQNVILIYLTAIFHKKVIVCPAELGSGWALTVVNSSAEFDIIRRGLEFLDVYYYAWFIIGGSTNTNRSQPFNYSEYIPGQSG